MSGSRKMPASVGWFTAYVCARRARTIMQRLLQAGYMSALTCALAVLGGRAGMAVADDATSQLGRDTTRVSSQTTAHVYECGDGFTFVARIEGETAWLFLPRRTVRLPHVSSGSGAKYSEGPITLWTKGEEAMLEVGDGTLQNCRNNRAMAIWEDAKFRGVDFRAVGNEPGWNLEISEGADMVFVGDYGQSKYRFSTPVPSVDQGARRTTYTAEDEDQEVVIVIEGRRCQDTMRGDSFETTVTAVLGGKKYQGCGRALH